MFKKVIACILSIAMVLTISLQGNQVVLAIEEPSDLIAEQSMTEKEMLPEEDPEEAEIIQEDIEKRDRYAKEFLMSDMSHLAVIYPEPVHYLKNEDWVDIDNTLQYTTVNGKSTLQNTAGAWNIFLPDTLNKDRAVSVQRDQYLLSFYLKEQSFEEAVPLEPQPEAELPREDEMEPVEDVIEENPDIQPDEENPDIQLEEGNIDKPDELTIDKQQKTKQVDKPITPEKVQKIQPINESFAKIDRTSKAERINMTEKQKRTIPEKLQSALVYEKIFEDTDLRYDLQGEELKESIIINNKPESTPIYRYTLQCENLKLELQKDNSIFAIATDKKSSEPVFMMPAPVMIDNNGEENWVIEVRLEKTEDGYELTYLPSEDWLMSNERSWPVILDPVVKSDSDQKYVQNITVGSIKNRSDTSTQLYVGYESTYGQEHVFLKFGENSLPKMTSADVIVNATVGIVRYVTPNPTTNESQINVHKVQREWNVSTIKWTNQPECNSLIEDYAIVKGNGGYTWDVTTMVQGWYDNPATNYGMMFKVPDDNENSATYRKQFLSTYSSYGVEKRPTLYITYVNNNGLESYWNYHSQSVGRAGTGYVNDFSGNLVWMHEGLGFSGNRMPVQINMVYNSNDKGNNNFGMGFGWRSNYNQRVYEWIPANKLDKDDTYYIWEDEDGTRIYFKYYVDDIYLDESGQGMSFIIFKENGKTSGYSIIDKKGNTSYFDTKGRLTKIENNQATKSAVYITYLTDNLISSITDGAGRKYNFIYNNGLIQSIQYTGTGSMVLKELSYTHENSNIESITYPDGKTVWYSFIENRLLSSVRDIDGYRIQYTYNTTSATLPNRVIKIEEFVNSSPGGVLDIEYGYNQTVFKDLQGHKEIYHFNSYGNTVSVQDDLGHAQFAKYAQDSDSSARANQMTLSSKMQNTVSNMLLNSYFADDSYWCHHGNDSGYGTTGYTSAEKYIGNRSAYITRTASGALWVYSSVDIPVQAGETYTLSGYIKTTGMNGTGSGAALHIEMLGTGIPWAVSERINTNTEDWQRIEVTYSVPADLANPKMRVLCGNDSIGTAYFDCLQLEKAPTASRYNLIQNGDFTHQGATANDAAYWTGSTNNNNRRTIVAGNTAAPQLDSYACEIEGDAQNVKYIYQNVIVSGSAGDTYILAGWARGKMAPEGYNEPRMLELAATFNDGSGSYRSLKFNSDSDKNWQYVSEPIVAKGNYTQIQIKLSYVYNINTVWVDGIQLFKDDGANTYKYDSNTGNLTSITDLRNKNTSFIYNGTNDIIEATQPNGGKLVYTYDHHNVTSSTSAMNLKNENSYDTYGNNTSARVINPSNPSAMKIESNSIYTSDGNYITGITDSNRKTTSYWHNTETGVLEWIASPKDTYNGRTMNYYDNLYRLAGTEKAVSGLSGGRSTTYTSYTYENDQIKTIAHSNTSSTSTTYTFDYNQLLLPKKISVGNKELVANTYNGVDKGFTLNEAQYGNRQSVSYSYDSYNRVTGVYYKASLMANPVLTYTYKYDNDGDLSTITDVSTGIVTKYIKDSIGRPVQTIKKNTSTGAEILNTKYTYDNDNNVSAVKSLINGSMANAYYTYGKDYRPTAATLPISGGNAAYKTYSYDAYGRLYYINNYNNNNNQTTYFLGTSISYTNPDAAHTSNQITSWTNYGTNGSKIGDYIYYYDDNGNITSYIDARTNVSYGYGYDELNQLKTELRYENNVEKWGYVYTYDAGGNIKSKVKYLPGGVYAGSDTYTYDDPNWPDLLTQYNGQPLGYDEIGNLTADGTWDYTWQKGRQLAGMAKNGTNISFTYDENGLRSSKTVNGVATNYVYNGSQLLGMTKGNDKLLFRYDANGQAISFDHSGTTYFYIYNAQGDVVGIVDMSGNIVVEYTYDAWGNPLSITGTLASTIGQLNPFRYRGYVWDSETGLFYVNSRYYNPTWGRWINGDDRLLTQETAGYNLFAYCNNNPVNMIDPSGHVGYSIYDYYYGKGFYCVKDYGEWAVFANRKTGATETWGKKESKDKSKGGGVYGAQWGVSGGLAIFGSAQLMYVRDGEGNEAVAYVFGVGGGVGASAGGSIVIFPEEGMTVFDLEGQGVAAGISAAVVSVDYQGSGGYNGVSGGGGVPIAPIGKIGLGLYGSTTFTTIFAYRKAGGEWQWK